MGAVTYTGESGAKSSVIRILAWGDVREKAWVDLDHYRFNPQLKRGHDMDV